MRKFKIDVNYDQAGRIVFERDELNNFIEEIRKATLENASTQFQDISAGIVGSADLVKMIKNFFSGLISSDIKISHNSEIKKDLLD